MLTILGERIFGHQVAIVALAVYLLLGAVMIATLPDALPHPGGFCRCPQPRRRANNPTKGDSVGDLHIEILTNKRLREQLAFEIVPPYLKFFCYRPDKHNHEAYGSWQPEANTMLMDNFREAAKPGIVKVFAFLVDKTIRILFIFFNILDKCVDQTKSRFKVIKYDTRVQGATK